MTAATLTTISIYKAVSDHEIPSENKDLTCSFPEISCVWCWLFCLVLVGWLVFLSFIDPFKQKGMVSY